MIRYKTPYFDKSTKIVINSILGILAIALVQSSYFVNVIVWIAVINLILNTTYYQIQFRTDKNQISDQFIFCLLPVKAKVIHYKNYLGIKISRERQSINAAGSRLRDARPISYTEYTAELILENQSPFCIDSDTNFQVLQEKVENLAKKLNTDIIN